MMIVGLTYDLQDDYLAQGYSLEETAEFDKIETIDSLDHALATNGYCVRRIGNVQALVKALAQGERWDIVFNVCEGLKGIAREAQVPALLEAYDIPFVFSDAETMVTTMDKSLAKRLVAEQGVPTPPFAVIRTLADVDSLTLPFPLFAKPLAEGTGKGINRDSYIETKEDLRAKCKQILETYHQPALVEAFLPGRDLTVGIVGNGDQAHSIGVMESFYKEESSKIEGQSFYNKENWKKTLSYEIVTDQAAKEAAEIAVASWRILNCRDGGRIDLRCDKNNKPHFLEVNPLAGLRPGHSDLPMLAEKNGICHESLIGQIIDAACARYGLQKKKNADVTQKDSAKNKKKIVVLYSGSNDSTRQDEKDTLLQLEEISSALRNLNYLVFAVPFQGSIGSVEKAIQGYQADEVFNLVESVEGSDKLQYVATALLDHMKLPYTGSKTATMAMLADKTQMKKFLRRNNILTPDFYHDACYDSFFDSENLWIVKSNTEHASVGLNAESVVRGSKKAILVVKEKKKMYQGDWFIERYIEGREFNLAILGRAGCEPLFLAPTEIVFEGYSKGAAKIVDYDSKWNEESFSYKATKRRHDFDAEDESLLKKMKEICRECWKIFGLEGAVRIDFRVDAYGEPWVIDVNANACLSSDAGFMAAAKKDGMTLENILSEFVLAETTYVSH